MSEVKGHTYIYILLTRYKDLMSKIILWMMGGKYVHASLGLNENFNHFYSFNKNGFRLEHPLKPHRREVPCALYRIKISESEHAKLIVFLNHFEKQRKRYSYAWVGIILCCLHIVHKSRRRYFCSQFVAEALSASGVVKLWKSSSLFIPDDLEKIDKMDLYFEGTLGGLEDFVKRG